MNKKEFTMTKTAHKLAGLFLFGLAGLAYACSTHTYILNGKVVTCTTCCAGQNCTTNCW